MQAPLGLNVERLATRYSVGDASFAECVDFSPEHPAKLHLIPRGGGTSSQSERMCGNWEADCQCVVLRLINASCYVPPPTHTENAIIVDLPDTACGDAPQRESQVC